MYDDGSGKESADFIRKAAAMDERIVYLRGSRNLGLAAALNICISYAAGKYVARMDADDIAKRSVCRYSTGFWNPILSTSGREAMWN